MSAMSQSKLQEAIEKMGVAEFDSVTVLCTQLIDCITRRIEIEFLYDDDPSFICHPYVLFVGPRNVLLLEGLRPGRGFKDFDIRRLRGFEVTNRGFEPDLSFDLDNAKYRQVICSIHDV